MHDAAVLDGTAAHSGALPARATWLRGRSSLAAVQGTLRCVGNSCSTASWISRACCCCGCCSCCWHAHASAKRQCHRMHSGQADGNALCATACPDIIYITLVSSHAARMYLSAACLAVAVAAAAGAGVLPPHLPSAPPTAPRACAPGPNTMATICMYVSGHPQGGCTRAHVHPHTRM